MTTIRTLPGALAPVRRGIGPRVAHDPGDPLITSHCPFCGSGQVVGRSDGTIGCDFCGQNYIVRVQPAFPGMPQMPGGPGAPSDVGPDGGLVDPGMIGPDGMPADEGPPGDDEGAPPFGDDGEGPPPGAGEEGGDDAPPPSGDGDDSSGPPEKKGDSKKKPPPKKAARYRGLQGQLLDEDQYVRHLAAALSGGHPSVLASLRAEASLRRSAHSPEYVPVATEAELRHHVAQDHGMNPSGWDEATLRKLHDHDHATASRDYGWESSPDAAHSPGFVAARRART